MSPPASSRDMGSILIEEGPTCWGQLGPCATTPGGRAPRGGASQ